MTESKLYHRTDFGWTSCVAVDREQEINDLLAVKLAFNELGIRAIKGGSVLVSFERRFHVTTEGLQKFMDLLSNLPGSRVVCYQPAFGTEDSVKPGEYGTIGWHRITYVWNTGAILVQNNQYGDEDEWVDIQGAWIDDELVKKINVIVREHTPPSRPKPDPAGEAFIMCKSRGQIVLQPIGLAGNPLSRALYPQRGVLEGFDKAVADLRSKNPMGRLVILDGPPGTGKTFMVRAMMHAAAKTKFVIVPPHLIADLADPELVTAMLAEVESDGSRSPLALILEDADECLAARVSANMSSISSILNLSDGIIGALLDLRVVATTNTPSTDFDPALLRAGRMSAHIQLGPLPEGMVRDVYLGISGEEEPPSDLVELNRIKPNRVVLADVFASFARTKIQPTTSR